MPEGITRTSPGASRYLEDRHPILHDRRTRCCARWPSTNKPVQSSRSARLDAAEHTPAGGSRVPDGTISSQLYAPVREGVSAGSSATPTKHALIYTITDKGEDVLTRPDPQPALDLRPMEGSA